jgi:hypothetical protein
MQVDFKPFYNQVDQVNHDTSIVVNGITILAHQIILKAASPYFRRTLHPHRAYEFKQFTAPIVERVIKYIYGFDIEISKTDYYQWESMWTIAKFLELDTLKTALLTELPFGTTPALRVIQFGRRTKNTTPVDAGIDRLCLNPATAKQYASEAGADDHAYVRARWLERGIGAFGLFGLDCEVAKGYDFKEAREHIGVWIRSIDFRAFTREQCEIAKGFPVIKDWPLMVYMISQLHPV